MTHAKQQETPLIHKATLTMCDPCQSLVECRSLQVIGKGDMARLSQQPAGDSCGVWVSEKPLSKLLIGYSFTLKFRIYLYHISQHER